MKILGFAALAGILITMVSLLYGLWVDLKADSEKIIKCGFIVGTTITLICTLILAGIDIFSMQ